jgi:G3E family GTPase
VLVNDIGKAGIDGEILSADGIESIELPSGCVCCTLKNDLMETVRKVIDNFSPELLLVEPSGVASPSGVLDAFRLLDIKPVTVVSIVDANEFLDLYESDIYGNFFMDQILNADIILVNKTDLVAEQKIERTTHFLEDMNQTAMVFRTVNAVMHEAFPALSEKERVIRNQNAHFHFETVSLRLSDTISFRSLEKVFHNISEGAYGSVVRAKALVNTDRGPYRFDSSFGTVDQKHFKKVVSEGRIVVIGKDINKDGILSEIERKGYLQDH